MSEVDTLLLDTIKRPQAAAQAKRKSWHQHQPATQAGTPDSSLLRASEHSLMKRKWDSLMLMCEQRGLCVAGETGLTKREMVRLLLGWREEQEKAQQAASEPASTVKHHPPDVPLLSNLSLVNLISALKVSPDHAPATPESTPTPPRPAQSPEETIDCATALDQLDLQGRRIEPHLLQRGHKIGSGGFKDVYKGRYAGRFRVAICDLRGNLTRDDVKELSLLRDFRHENIIRFIGVCVQPDATISIITELAMNGDLFHYIRQVPCPSFAAQLDIMLGCAKGLLYLHKRMICHRDIKSLNVLISSRGIPKLNDFGLAKVKSTIASMMHSQAGTINWQSPELWVPEPSYSLAVDVYALALVYWEILTWHQADKMYPFQGMNEFAIYQEVGSKRLRPSTSSLRKRYGNIAVNLLHALWSHDPDDRPGMADVVEALEWMVAEHQAGRLLSA